MSKNVTVVFTLAFVAFLSGCSLYQQPPGAPQLSFSQDWQTRGELFESDALTDSAWWERFDDPVLNELVAHALGTNLDVRVALTTIQQARAYYGLERWAYLPNAGIELSRDRGSFGDVELAGNEQFTFYRSGVGLNWELDLLGRVRNGTRIALAGLYNSTANTDAVRLLVASEVANTYYLARAAFDRHQIRSNALMDQWEITEMTRVLVEEQREAEDALSLALAQLAQDEVELVLEQEYVQRLEHRLALLLGQQPGQWRLPEFTAVDAPLRLQAISVGDVAALLRNRPDIRIAEQDLIAQQAAVGIARADYFPTLQLTGYFGYIAGSSGDLGGSGTDTWFVGPRLIWNALDFGRTRQRVAIANAQVEQAYASYEGTVLRAIEETENALLRYSAAHSEVGHRESQRHHARAAAIAARTRYEEGLDNYLDALILRRDALGAEVAYVNGLAGHRLATVDVFRALGVAPL